MFPRPAWVKQLEDRGILYRSAKHAHYVKNCPEVRQWSVNPCHPFVSRAVPKNAATCFDMRTGTRQSAWLAQWDIAISEEEPLSSMTINAYNRVVGLANCGSVDNLQGSSRLDPRVGCGAKKYPVNECCCAALMFWKELLKTGNLAHLL